MAGIGVDLQSQLQQRGREILGVQGESLLIEAQKSKTADLEMEGDERGELLLTIRELFIATSEPDEIDADFLVLILPAWSAEEEGAPLLVFLPEAVRGSLSKSPHGITIADLVIGPCELNCRSLSLGVYGIGRTPGARRILASLQDLTAAVDFADDYDGSISLAHAILDRIELLGEITGTTLLFQKHLVGGMDQKVRKSSRYCAFIEGEEPESLSGKLWVNNRRLMMGDSPASSALPDANHILLRLGYRSGSQDIRRYIDELRRKHALRREELSANTQSESYGSYLEKEAERQKEEILSSLYGHHNMLPVVTPIAVEAAANLEEFVNLGESEETVFGKALKVMRQRFASTFGVKIPGLRVRLNETDLADGAYLIMVNEIPLAMGNVSVDQGFCSAPADKLRDIGIKAEEASHPIHGGEASWVPAADMEKIRASGYEAYGPGEYILLHVEALLRKDLRLFVTLDELDQTIPDGQKEKLSSAGFYEGGIVRFREVISCLLDEGLPIDDLPDLLDAYLECEKMPAYAISEQLRSVPKINALITRDVTDWHLFSLSSDIENVVSRGILRFDDAGILTLEPEKTQEILSAVRNAIPDRGTYASKDVIVVRNGEIRPHFSNLIDLEFPRVRVVAKQELDQLNPDIVTPGAEISFE